MQTYTQPQTLRTDKLIMLYKCRSEDCDKAFLSKIALEQHLIDAHGFIEKCGMADCSEKFKSKLELLEHLRKIHNWEGQKGKGHK